MDLNYIEFSLENCEVIKIDGKYIGDFLVDDIKTQIMRTACNSIDKMDICGTFIIEISKSANELYKPFSMAKEEYKFNRLKYNDITSIEFQLSHDNQIEHYYYYVDYDSDNQDYAPNLNQQSYLSELGNLYIVVDKKCKDNPDRLFEFFSKEQMNNKEEMNFRFDVCGVE